MKRVLTIFFVLTLIFIYGCSESRPPIILECKAPLIIKGEGCCMDSDYSGVCDIDEQNKENGDEDVVQTQENPTDENKQEINEKITEIETNTQEEAENTARLFAEKWNEKQYSVIYAMFSPELKKKKTATEFAAIMALDHFYSKITKIEFKGIKKTDSTSADISIKAYTNIQEIEIPGVSLEFIDGTWRINAFTDVFDLDSYEAACAGYANNNKYTMADCAFDFAKKMRNPSYCNRSGCNYAECLKALGQPSGMKQEAEQCFFCQPTGKNVNQCILDVAIKHDKIAACDVISDNHYSDKYCTCYGGFANHKNNQGYCNIITNQEYKELCIDGYNGKYC